MRIDFNIASHHSRHHHLIKFMSLILPNGYIFDTIGPFWGTMNDASIAKSIANTCDTLTKWCEKGDTMIVDRGFRDVIESFIEMDYEARMPDFLTNPLVTDHPYMVFEVLQILPSL